MRKQCEHYRRLRNNAILKQQKYSKSPKPNQILYPKIEKDKTAITTLYAICEHDWAEDDGFLRKTYHCEVVFCKNCKCIRKKDSDIILKLGDELCN